MKKLLLSLFLSSSIVVFAANDGGTSIDINFAQSTLANIRTPQNTVLAAQLQITPEGAVLHSASFQETRRVGAKLVNFTHYGVCVYKNGYPGNVSNNPLFPVVICPANSYYLNVYSKEEVVVKN